ncbi:MAG TPA: glycine zipper 2TM domain-containing protein [Candidatus Pseudomonas excrementavium]|uniref:glycine zipper 2TM domain-containing protein n=1 Tax=Halopseudomonas bauzanensis TaxID=653930 RepID=UPI001C3A32E5|nr:glycine zipper 2TM domain-containing protein [Halopseudomonas bauzanensis]HIZ50352.1 glycine zipper 2TM domain-containing protein [Candidatus Pseudomonas excrementavium]
MNKSMLSGIVIGAIVATAGGAIAGYNALSDKTPTHAQVLNVVEIKENERIPREVCEQVTVTRQKPVQDQHQVLGSVAGAVIGGVLGNQVGGGTGKKIATVAGAAAGGYAGNKTQERIQQGNTYTTTENRCETVYDNNEKIVGYQVDYSIGDENGTVRMDRHPGDTIPLQNGQLVLAGQ